MSSTETTPRPWRTWGMQLRASTCDDHCADYDHSIVIAQFYTERDGHPRTHDLDLTIKAVAIYDALAGMSRPRQGDPDWVFEVWRLLHD